MSKPTYKPASKESTLQRQILRAIGAEPDVYVLVNAVGQATFFTEQGRQYHVTYGLEDGSPDLVLFVQGRDGLARVVGLEVKRPGEHPRENQSVCHARWRARGALVYVVHSIDEAKAAVVDARRVVANPSSNPHPATLGAQAS